MTMSKLFTHFFASFKIYPFVLCWWLVGSVGCGGRTHSNFVLFISSSNLLLSIPIAHISDVDCPRLNTALALSFKSSFWMGQPRPLLHLFSVFSIKHCNFTANYCYKNVPPMLGFDLSTFCLWYSDHNHYTRVLTLFWIFLQWAILGLFLFLCLFLKV